MNSIINDYVSKYVTLCAQTCRKAEDFTKENVAKNNKVVRKLIKLQEEIHKDPQLTSSVYEILLEHEDMYVRHSAATECLLYLKIHIDVSVAVLEAIVHSGEWFSMTTARRNLLIWEGVIAPDGVMPQKYWDELRELKASIDAQNEAQ